MTKEEREQHLKEAGRFMTLEEKETLILNILSSLREVYDLLPALYKGPLLTALFNIERDAKELLKVTEQELWDEDCGD